MSLEQELRRALKRKDPPSGLRRQSAVEDCRGRKRRATPRRRRRTLDAALAADRRVADARLRRDVLRAATATAAATARAKHRRRPSRRRARSCSRFRSRARPSRRHRPRLRRLPDMNPRTTINCCLLLLALLIPRDASAQGARLQLDHLTGSPRNPKKRSTSLSIRRCSKKRPGFLAGKGSDTEKVHELIEGITRHLREEL